MWLSESFAEYMGHRVAMDATEFKDVWVDNAFGRKYWGLTDDQRPSTHPIALTGATHSEDALQYLDGITYAKGAAAVKQLNTRLGDEVFFSGLRQHFAQHAFGNATMDDLFTAWESAGASDLREWSENWLGTADVDLLRLDRSGPDPRLVRGTPAAHPATRQHAMSVARHDPSSGWLVEPVTVRSESTSLPSTAGQPVVLDPRDQTWARTSLDELTLAAMPDLLPQMDDAVMRASVWNAVRDGVRNALVSPEAALHLVECGLPHETQDIAVSGLIRFGLEDVADRLVADPDDAYMRVHGAVRRRVDTAKHGSTLQLSAMRGLVASCADPVQLRAWLSDTQLPRGVRVDPDLRWKILTRLATLGSIERPELREWLDRAPSTEAQVSLTQCMCSLPDDEAKSYAWTHFTGELASSNYQVEAAGLGMWHVGQEAVTAPYVARYFHEMAATKGVRSGYMLGDTARSFFPRMAMQRSTLDAAEQALTDSGLDPGLRRALVDETDELRRGLAVLALNACIG